jgi:hypothetical protein
MGPGNWWLKVTTIDGVDHTIGPVDDVDVRDWVLHAWRADKSMSVGFPLHGIWSWHMQNTPFTEPGKVAADG